MPAKSTTTQLDVDEIFRAYGVLCPRRRADEAGPRVYTLRLELTAVAANILLDALSRACDEIDRAFPEE